MGRIGELRKALFIGLMLGTAAGVIMVALVLSVTTKIEAQSLHNESLQIQRVINLSGSDQLLVICDFTNGHAYVMARNSGGTDLEVIPDNCTKKNSR